MTYFNISYFSVIENYISSHAVLTGI